VLSKLEHFVRNVDVGNILEIERLIAHLLWVAQRDAKQSLSTWL
jgi:hypothetical protein